MEPYIIVGNGVAAVTAAEAIRARGNDTRIIIFTDQECAFYSRPCLYYVMLGRIEWEDAWGRPDAFYPASNVDLRCSTRITKINPEAHTVEVAGHGTLSYSRLLLAAGTHGRTPPWADQPLRGIVGLNTLLDVISITDLLGQARRAVVAGGGLTSIELVEVCRHWGVPATFITRGRRFLESQLNDDEAEFVHQRLRDSGVEIATQEEIESLNGKDGRVALAVTKSGREIECGLVGCAVGVVPNKELAEDVGGETKAGIVVDDHMRTTLPDVLAAGDCSQVRQPDGTVAAPEMLWYVAADMGRVAGANMAGGDATYQRRVLLNVSEFCGLDFCGVGAIVPGQSNVEETVIRDSRGEGSIRLVTRDGVLIGACFLGDIRLADIARGIVERGARLADLSSSHPLRALIARRSP
jgi:NAD(P)H-nitrite reductase large subunit